MAVIYYVVDSSARLYYEVAMLDEEAVLRRRRQECWQLTAEERMERFFRLQETAFAMMSERGWEHFHRRNHQKRRMSFDDGSWSKTNDIQAP